MIPTVKIEKIGTLTDKTFSYSVVYVDSVQAGLIVRHNRPGIWTYYEEIPNSADTSSWVPAEYTTVANAITRDYLMWGLHEAAYSREPYLSYFLHSECGFYVHESRAIADRASDTYTYAVYSDWYGYALQLLNDMPEFCSLENFVTDWLFLDSADFPYEQESILRDAEIFSEPANFFLDCDQYIKTAALDILNFASEQYLLYKSDDVAYIDADYRDGILVVRYL